MPAAIEAMSLFKIEFDERNKFVALRRIEE